MKPKSDQESGRRATASAFAAGGFEPEKGRAFLKTRISTPSAVLRFVLAWGLAAACITCGWADISGFGNSGAGWTLNYANRTPPNITNGVLHLTDASLYLANSAYFNATQDIQGFRASFTWQCTTSYETDFRGDGFTFVIQRGSLSAIGSNGGGLGYTGIGQSVALAFNIMGGETGQGIALCTNGIIGSYTVTSPVNLHLNNPMKIMVMYDGALLTAQIQDLSTGHFFTNAYAIDIPATVGGSHAYVGFTAGSGRAYGYQNLWDFTLESAPTLTVQNAVVVCWPTQEGKNYQLQYRSDIDSNLWFNIGETVAGTGSTNCQVDLLGQPRRFYRVRVIP